MKSVATIMVVAGWLLLSGGVLAVDVPAQPTADAQRGLQQSGLQQNVPATQAGAPTEAEVVAANPGRAAAVMKRLTSWTRADAARVAARLQADIARGTLEVEAQKRRILVRVLDRDAFSTGSAILRPSFLPVLDKVYGAIRELPGDISVEGHTDDIPVNSARFRSSWELSSARASAVAQELLRKGELAPTRFRVVGYGNTRPLVANTTEANRALNRRVEIIIDQSGDDVAYLSGEKPVPAAPKPASAADELF